MSGRRILISLAALSLAAACNEGTAPTSLDESGPHFLQWSGRSTPQFAATGATMQGAVPFDGAAIDGLSLSSAASPYAVTLDRATSATASTSALTWSHQVGSGTNSMLIVGVSIRNGGKTVTGVTYGGRSLSFLSARNNDDNAVRVELWYLTAPASGTANVTVTLSGGAKVVGGAVSFFGVDPVSPFGSLASAGSEGTGDTHPTIEGITSGAGEMVLAAVATEGDAVTMTPEGEGQVAQWSRAYGTSGGDVWGAGSTLPGTASTTARWKTKAVKWAVSAVALQPPVNRGLGLSAYQASFWAVRGQQRSIQIDYAGDGGAALPFLRLTTYDPTYVPGRGPLAVGDSVLVTVTVDPVDIAVHLEPSGLQFGQSSQLKIWYGGAGGDLNGDGVVDATDSYIESQLLGMWYQADVSSPWTPIAASKSLAEKSVTAALGHFSGYAVSW